MPAQAQTKLKNITFRVAATAEQKRYFKSGWVPWISIKNPKPLIARLKKAHEIVVKQHTVILVVDYPVNKKAFFPLSSKEGFSRAKLALLISQKYHHLYKVEEKTAQQKTIPLKERKGFINRNETNGRYGIWAHDIDDLDLTDIDVVQKKWQNLSLSRCGQLILHVTD